MNLVQIIAILIFVIIIAVCIIFRKTMLIKKYWRYGIIILPAILFIFLKILATKTIKKDDKPDNLNTYISDVKDQLQEIKLKTAVEVAITREDNKQKLEQLKQVCKISDSAERRQKLAEMME